MPLLNQHINRHLVGFLAGKLRNELGFRVPIFFQVFLIIRLFEFIPTEFIISTAIHGFSNSTFHQLCDKQGPIITIMTLNGNIVVAVLEKSWDTQDALNLGYQKDRSCKMFHVTSTGEIVKLRCRGFYNSHSYGPDFKYLHVNLDRKQADSCFP
jgi:hypothetical protein